MVDQKLTAEIKARTGSREIAMLSKSWNSNEAPGVVSQTNLTKP